MPTTQPLPTIPGYQLEKLLGNGGMASVYLARPASGGDKVAIKILRTPGDADHQWSARFLREAAMVRRFDHPNIVRMLDAGEHEGRHYLVMEYLDHGDLTTWIRQGLQPQDALRLLRPLAQALAYAHRLGYIHRDVKPDNVLFRADGTPVLTDFGIARPRETSSRLTQVGMVIGTPRYMSPEQHRGQQLDPRSDIYSLGIVYYEMLTRSVPFDGADSMSIGIKHVSEPVPRLPARMVHYQRLLDHMLAKNPVDRLPNGETLVKALDALLAQPEPSTKNAMTAADALKQGLLVEETETKTGLFSKARDIRLSVGADDYNALQLQCGKATQALTAWHGKAGKKARHITLDFYVHPWIHALTRDVIKRITSLEEFTFLHTLKTRVRIHDLSGVLEADFTLEPADPAAEQH